MLNPSVQVGSRSQGFSTDLCLQRFLKEKYYEIRDLDEDPLAHEYQNS